MKDEGKRSAVGIYDRPHPLRRRQVWLPIAIASAAIACSLAFWFVT
jgi:hypothetical protein